MSHHTTTHDDGDGHPSDEESGHNGLLGNDTLAMNQELEDYHQNTSSSSGTSPLNEDRLGYVFLLETITMEDLYL